MHLTSKLSLASILLMFACASAGSGSGSGSNQLLTRQQLESAPAQNLYDVVMRLRPQWLNSRGPGSVVDATPQTPTVYLDGSRVGDAEFLRRINLSDVEEVRYWRPGEASARFGMNNPRGVIEVISRSDGFWGT